MKNTTATCMKKPDSGPCRAYILRWYYDHHHRVCKMFVYGGCQGNGNSFATEEKCRATCMPTSTDQGTCSADPKPRPCTARAQLWYFDHEENLCHRFTPGSCGSTANRFPTCRKCMMRCSNLTDPKQPTVGELVAERKYFHCSSVPRSSFADRIADVEGDMLDTDTGHEQDSMPHLSDSATRAALDKSATQKLQLFVIFMFTSA
ncbi:hypothetical protein MRX96_044510 [Rhipicephalus microplus]